MLCRNLDTNDKPHGYVNKRNPGIMIVFYLSYHYKISPSVLHTSGIEETFRQGYTIVFDSLSEHVSHSLARFHRLQKSYSCIPLRVSEDSASEYASPGTNSCA
jgi:hypothetical protein